MGQPAAKQNDHIFATDTHIVMVPSPSGQVPTPIPGHVFNAPMLEGLSADVFIDGRPDRKSTRLNSSHRL